MFTFPRHTWVPTKDVPTTVTRVFDVLVFSFFGFNYALFPHSEFSAFIQ